MSQAMQASLDGSVGAVIVDAQPASDTPCAIHCSVHSDLVAVEAEWRAFEQVADCTVFQSFDWLSTWQRHIGSRTGVVPAIVTGRDYRGELLFLFAFGIETARLARRLTWLGTDLCDYNGPMLAPAFATHCGAAKFRKVWRGILQSLRQHPQLRFDVIAFDKMPAFVGAQRNPFMEFGVMAHPNGAYVTDLAPDWDTFYNAKRSSPVRKRDRYRRRKLGELGDVSMQAADTAADILRVLEALIEQKSRSFARMGVANLFDTTGYRDFLRDLATDSRLKGLTHVSSLNIGGAITAVNFGLQFRKRYYHLLASYDDGPASRFGAGTLHLQELLRYAVDNRFTQFDFTIGDEHYKAEWCDSETVLFDYVAPTTLRGWPAVALTTAVRRIKRFIKQTPALWDMAAKLRASLGPLTRRLRG
jgi:CelD/BcsL family acetyltransferase involved in cellulose biosynthesis